MGGVLFFFFFFDPVSLSFFSQFFLLSVPIEIQIITSSEERKSRYFLLFGREPFLQARPTQPVFFPPLNFGRVKTERRIFLFFFSFSFHSLFLGDLCSMYTNHHTHHQPSDFLASPEKESVQI